MNPNQQGLEEYRVTIFFRENLTLRDETASQAALLTRDEEEDEQGRAFRMHLLRFR